LPAVETATLLRAWEIGEPQPQLQRALTLLAAACPERSADEWARAWIGERDARLFALHEELFGGRFETVAACPVCGDRLEAGFTTAELGVADGRVPSDRGRAVRASGYEVEFRPPTSLDLWDTVGRADQRTALLGRCIEAARWDGAEVGVAILPDPVVDAVLEGMREADPLADLQVGLTCGVCGHRWSMTFDIVAYLWSEIDDWAQGLLREVHALASAYGWSERDIFALGASRRRTYLELANSP